MSKKLLPTGTTLYGISESTTDYRFSGTPYHYEIVKGKISEIIRGGYTEYKINTWSRCGSSSLRFVRTNCVGVSWFKTWDEAVEYVERMTEHHEKKFGYMYDRPLMRPWREGEFE